MGGQRQKPSAHDVRMATQALEKLFVLDYISKRALYLQNFVRGIFFGLGSAVGATIVIALIAWMLSLFNSVPIIGPLLDDAQQSLQQTK